jgi:hypothetical protein
MGVAHDAGGFSDGDEELESERSEEATDAADQDEQVDEQVDEQFDEFESGVDSVWTEREGAYVEELEGDDDDAADVSIEGYGGGGDEPSAEPGGDEFVEPAGQDETLYEIREGEDFRDQEEEDDQEEDGGQAW